MYFAKRTRSHLLTLDVRNMPKEIRVRPPGEECIDPLDVLSCELLIMISALIPYEILNLRLVSRRWSKFFGGKDLWSTLVRNALRDFHCRFCNSRLPKLPHGLKEALQPYLNLWADKGPKWPFWKLFPLPPLEWKRGFLKDQNIEVAIPHHRHVSDAAWIWHWIDDIQNSVYCYAQGANSFGATFAKELVSADTPFAYDVVAPKHAYIMRCYCQGQLNHTHVITALVNSVKIRNSYSDRYAATKICAGNRRHFHIPINNGEHWPGETALAPPHSFAVKTVAPPMSKFEVPRRKTSGPWILADTIAALQRSSPREQAYTLCANGGTRGREFGYRRCDFCLKVRRALYGNNDVPYHCRDGSILVVCQSHKQEASVKNMLVPNISVYIGPRWVCPHCAPLIDSDRYRCWECRFTGGPIRIRPKDAEDSDPSDSSDNEREGVRQWTDHP